MSIYDPPPAFARRGGDVRWYCRSCEDEGYGDDHWFVHTTDVCLTNGLIRFWVGNRGMTPFLNVQAVGAGKWRECGVLALAADHQNVLLGARLGRVSPDASSILLTLDGLGDVAVSIVRAERQLRIQHGVDGIGAVSAHRRVRLLGTPPAKLLSPASDAGAFFAGHRQTDADDSSEFLWPADVDEREWTVVYRWLPTDASDDLGTSGLLSIYDTADERAVHTRFDGADHKIKVTVGAVTLATSALSFDADDVVYIGVGVSPTEGLVLAVATPASPFQAVQNLLAVDPGTLDRYDYFSFRTQGPGTYGQGTYGEGTWGGQIASSGVVDNVQIFAAGLDADRQARLAAASTALDGIRGVEGHLRWFAPFDVAPVISAAPVVNGRMVEPAPGLDGLRRMVAGLPSVVSGNGDFGLVGIGQRVDFAVGVLEPGEAASDFHEQFASVFEQEVYV